MSRGDSASIVCTAIRSGDALRRGQKRHRTAAFQDASRRSVALAGAPAFGVRQSSAALGRNSLAGSPPTPGLEGPAAWRRGCSRHELRRPLQIDRLRVRLLPWTVRQLLECGCPLPLWISVRWQTPAETLRIGQLGEAVKKSKTEKIRLRKPLICRERNLCFRAICQFFHSFGEPTLPDPTLKLTANPTGQG